MVVFESRNLDFLNADRLNVNIIMLSLYFVHVFIFLYVPSQARKTKNALQNFPMGVYLFHAAMVLRVSKRVDTWTMIKESGYQLPANAWRTVRRCESPPWGGAAQPPKGGE